MHGAHECDGVSGGNGVGRMGPCMTACVAGRGAHSGCMRVVTSHLAESALHTQCEQTCSNFIRTRAVPAAARRRVRPVLTFRHPAQPYCGGSQAGSPAEGGLFEGVFALRHCRFACVTWPRASDYDRFFFGLCMLAVAGAPVACPGRRTCAVFYAHAARV